MAELQHILGSLFSDIAHSAFTSDLYSRVISRYYEADDLLRTFPVPRAEIAELDVELKFAIAGIELNPAQTIVREADSAPVFLEFCYDLSEGFYSLLHDKLVELKQQGKIVTREMINQAGSIAEAIYLRQDLLRFFIHNQGSLIEEGNFQVGKALEGIRDILEKKIYWIAHKAMDEKEREELYEHIAKELKLESDLKQLEEPLRYTWKRAGDFKLDVEITSDKLIELNSEQLSSVHVRTRVRNYKWADVEHEGRSWHALNPE